MAVYEAIVLMISFGALIVAILSFQNKNNHPLPDS